MRDIINLQIEIFMLIFIGYTLGKKGILDKSTRSKLTTMVLSVVLPFAIVKSFNMQLTKDILVSTGLVLIISFLIQLGYHIVNQFLYNHLDQDRKIVSQYATMVSNAGFMGMPVSEAAFGSTGLLYASIFLIPQRIFMWSAGLSLFTSVSKKDLIKKVATHPCIIAIYIGLICMLLRSLGVVFPDFVTMSINSVASCNTGLSMIIIGAILRDVPWSEFLDYQAIRYSILRLVILPLILLFILLAFHIPTDSIQVCVLLTGMPAASTTAMLAQSYDHNPGYASKLIFVSTVLSLITLPVWLVVLKSI